jgi:SPP1 Gp6-like portal protein
MGTTQAQPQYTITDADRERQKRIAKAWQAYEGDLDKPFSKMPDEPDMNVMGNEVQPAVDAVVNFVFGDEVEISAEQGAPVGAQELLDNVWGRKEARVPLLQRWLMNGEMAGRAFLRIVPGAKGSFRLVEIDPCTIFVKTAPQDCQTILLYCIQYSCDETNNIGKSVKMYYREEISRIDPDQDDASQYEDINADGIDDDVTWSIQHWTQEVTNGIHPNENNWVAVGDPIPWPYSFPPIFSNQNLPKPNDFWGYPGVNKSLIGVNEAINFVNSNINITGKLQRILYAPGMGEGTLDVSSGRIVQLPLPENEIKAVNLQSDVANSREFAGDLRGETEELTGVPMIASGRTAYMPGGNLSGIAIKLLFMSLLKKMGKMRCLYGETIIEVSQALLVLAGFAGNIDITLGWQDPLPADELHEVQAALAKGELGVSKTTRLRELGYDPEEEAKLCAEEAARDAALTPSLPESLPGVPLLPGQPKPPTPLSGQNQTGDTQSQEDNQPIEQKG